jgi:hypothetical protein
MAKINARDWIFEVSEDPDATTPVWAQIGGVESFELDLSEAEESVETTDFDSAGIAESQAMQRGAKLQVEGKLKRTGTTTQDAGQVAAQNLAALVGEESLGGVRFRHVDDTSWAVWTAWVSLGSKGGGINDKTSWSATFTRSGAATSAAVS